MVYIEPKLDWNVYDYFNMDPDYIRIKGNIEYLANEINEVFLTDVNLIKMENVLYDRNGTPTNIIYVSFLNNVVINTTALRDGLKNVGVYVSFESLKTYVENQEGWGYKDLIQIENNIYNIYQVVKKYKKAKMHLPLQLGMRGFV